MRIVLVSDTHGTRPELPNGDVLLHCGDLIHLGSFAEFKEEISWLKGLPHKHKVYVPGNHDCCVSNLMNQNLEPKLQEFLSPIVYLRDSSTVIEGLKLWGSPWVPENSGGDFNLPSDELLNKFRQIPRDTEVLITHAAPFGTLDTEFGEHLGSPELTQVIPSLSRLRLHTWGHVHGGAGIASKNGTTFCNAAKSAFTVDLTDRTA